MKPLPIILVALLVVIALGAAYFLWLSPSSSPSPETSPSPSSTSPLPPTSSEPGTRSESVRIRGEIHCLPHKGGGAQTAECAIGLKGDNGNYYGLVGLNQQDLISGKWLPGERVEVFGDLVAAPESIYAITGTISVKSIALAPGE